MSNLIYCAADGARCQKRAKCKAYIRYRTAEDRRTIPVIDSGKECNASNYKQFEA